MRDVLMPLRVHRQPGYLLVQHPLAGECGTFGPEGFMLTSPAVFSSRRFTRWPSPQNRKRPWPNIWSGGILAYNSTASTSATNWPVSSPRNAATTLHTASEKPPMFRMSLRFGACVEV